MFLVITTLLSFFLALVDVVVCHNFSDQTLRKNAEYWIVIEAIYIADIIYILNNCAQ